MKLFFQPVPHNEAVAFIKSRPVVTRAMYDELAPELRGLAFVISGMEDAAQLQAARDIIAKLPAGGNFEDVKAELLQALPWAGKKGERRAEFLLRHWGGVAYAAAAWKVDERQKDVFPYRQYITMGDDKVRDTHQALNGIILPVDSPFWKGHLPPWEFGCRCQSVVLMERDVEKIRQAEAGKDPAERKVLEGPILKKLEESATLIRGNGRAFDVRTPAEKGDGWTGWDPENLMAGVDLTKAQDRLSPEVWEKLVAFWNGPKAMVTPDLSTAAWISQKPGQPDLTKGQEDSAKLPGQPLTGAAAPSPPLSPGGRPAALPPVRPATTDPALQVGAHLQPAGKHKAEAAAISKEVDQAISQVHSDGGLKQSKLTMKPLTHTEGIYRRDYPAAPVDAQDYASSIILSTGSAVPHLTLTHETGHKIHREALQTPSLTKPVQAALRAVLAGLRGTRRVAEIRKATADTRDDLEPDKELFARAYAQYITTRSQAAPLLKEMTATLAEPVPRRLSVWEEDDFAPMVALFDNLFLSLGWISPK